MPERKLPRDFPEQQQKEPGRQSQMQPEPEVIRPGYKGSDKLLDKVAFIKQTPNNKHQISNKHEIQSSNKTFFQVL
ncbi:MAG: hypothetical protein A2010_16470 [Nitrospirae bacterium GWD2_57_9]|nr:MAG: hypothetical protein A2010_16470 [Nitrospirae bacterium GWD2_57_9]OGW48443.1 MAG: hypothetical protein A2078_09955 [Nitrospirae bacterium GWC2_57_9]